MPTIEQNKQKLIEAVKKELPDFVEAVQKSNQGDAIVFDQKAFAADFQDGEFRLLGMAVKYAGLMGREVHITP